MNAQHAINQKFTELCTKLGNIMFQKLDLDAKAEALQNEIAALNAIVPTVLKIEADLKAAQAAKDTLEKSQKTDIGT